MEEQPLTGGSELDLLRFPGRHQSKDGAVLCVGLNLPTDCLREFCLENNFPLPTMSFLKRLDTTHPQPNNHGYPEAAKAIAPGSFWG